MIMKRYLYVSALAAMALASCSSDDYIGNTPGNSASDIIPKEISFGGATGKISRATGTATDAGKLSNKFVVFGTKKTGESKQTVFDHYNVEWVAKTTDNEKTADSWEYAGKNKNTLNTTATNQTIKYWDYSASQYDFVAFSFGSATQGTEEGNVKASKISDNDFSYTLTGKASELIKCYIADKVTKSNSSSQYNQDVQFSFRSLGTKVNVGLYETIPGYSVKDVKFYSSATEQTASSEKPILFASSATIPASEVKHIAKITFDNDNKAKISYDETQTTKSRVEGEENAEGGTEETEAKNATSITFNELADKVGAESKEQAGNDYISRENSDKKTKPTDPVTVLPCTTVGALTLKVDYTLVSIDGSGETIKVTGATATIKANYTKWASNTSYTYIFKISDQTNGSTGGSGTTAGLYPITFDAVVTETGTSSDHEEEITKDTSSSNTGGSSSTEGE